MSILRPIVIPEKVRLKVTTLIIDPFNDPDPIIGGGGSGNSTYFPRSYFAPSFFPKSYFP